MCHFSEICTYVPLLRNVYLPATPSDVLPVKIGIFTSIPVRKSNLAPRLSYVQILTFIRPFKFIISCKYEVRDISVSIAGWSRDRVPVGVKYSASVQNGPGSHPASPGVKRPGRGVNNEPHLAPRLKKY